MKFLVTYMYEDEFVSQLMNMWQIAELYGFADCNGTRDYKVYGLSPDADPERLYIREGRHNIALFTKDGQRVTDYWDWDEH